MFYCLAIAFWQLLNTRICYVMLPQDTWRLPLHQGASGIQWLGALDLQFNHRYIYNGWSTSYWSAVRRWSRIQACRWRSRSRWSDIWRSPEVFVYIFELNVNTVKTLNFTKLRPIRTTIHTAHTCTSSAYWPLSCMWVVKLLLSIMSLRYVYVHFFYGDQSNHRVYANDSSYHLWLVSCRQKSCQIWPWHWSACLATATT